MARLEVQFDEEDTRLRIVNDHLKNVRSEVANTQGIVEAKNRELDSEAHLKTLKEREVCVERERVLMMMDCGADRVSCIGGPHAQGR